MGDFNLLASSTLAFYAGLIVEKIYVVNFTITNDIFRHAQIQMRVFDLSDRL